MKDELNMRNRIVKIIVDSKLPNEIKEGLNSIYRDYEATSKQCCTSLMRVNENGRTINKYWKIYKKR